MILSPYWGYLAERSIIVTSEERYNQDLAQEKYLSEWSKRKNDRKIALRYYWSETRVDAKMFIRHLNKYIKALVLRRLYD
jgi:hypothetical protein